MIPSASGAGPFPGGGEMGRRVREHDWSTTPLGPIASWPESLRTAVRLVLDSRYPMFVWWGRELVNLYNDAYAPMLGLRHPAALGRSARTVWQDVWGTVGPLTDVVMTEGRATWSESLLLVMTRHGYAEETYFTFSYSPVPDAGGGVGGVFCAVIEDTARVISERRLRALRALADAGAGQRSVDAACDALVAALAEHTRDVPFALLYLLDDAARVARLAAAAGVAGGTPVSPQTVVLGGDEPWPLSRVLASGAAVRLGDLAARGLPGGPWPEPAREAMVLPVLHPAQQRPTGVLVAGASPRRVLDDDYASFLALAAGHVGTAIATARAWEDERRRAEALAELDRAKTAFFGNARHEFRTPLTLVLGPLEDALADTVAPLAPVQRERLAVGHRNALRLLRLVNTLLDFTRIEAGRADPVFEPTDLATVTADLASVFRSATERAGLALEVDCPPLAEPVHVDRAMWEKVVLNLLSNAFKFTLEGGIRVALRAVDGHAELTVADTGVGIAPEEQARVFERFHRSARRRGRTQEGTGIGLALVRELVALHGGSVAVRSVLDGGSAFTVRIPLGTAHLPAARVLSRTEAHGGAHGAIPWVDEAMRWLAGGDEVAGVAPMPAPPAADAPRVLVADDNADMRDYLRRLLGEHFAVDVVADGDAALAAVRAAPPDLVVTDVMMPGRDGFSLLHAIRADPRTRTLPVLLLSARAGEEARVEGLDAGADDYVVKPFSARELLARVHAQLAMARARAESTRRIEEGALRWRTLAEALPQILWSAGADGGLDYVSARWTELTGMPAAAAIGRGWAAAVHPDDLPRTAAAWARARATGQVLEVDLRLRDAASGGWRWHVSRAAPLRDAAGRVVQWVGTAADVDDRRRDAERLARSEAVQRRHAERLGALARASVAIASAPTLDATLATVTREARAIIGAHQAAVSTTLDHGWAQAVSCVDLSDKYADHRGWEARPDGSGIYAEVCRTNRPMRLTEAELRAHPLFRGSGTQHHPPLRGWLAAPLVGHAGDNIGLVQLSDAYADEFDAEDEAILVQLAQLASAAVEKARAEEAVRHSERRLRRVVASGSLGIALGEGTTVRDVNDAFCALVGWGRDELVGRDWRVLVPPGSKPADGVDLGTLLQQRATASIEREYLRKDGSRVPVLLSAGIVREEPIEWVCFVADLSDRKRAERELAAHAQRLELLARASAALGGTLDGDRGLVAFARHVVGTFADWCIVDVRRTDGGFAPSLVAHADPADAGLAAALRGLPGAPLGADVVASGRTRLVEPVADDWWHARTDDAAALAALRALDASAVLTLPLVYGGDEVLGTMTLVAARRSGRRWDAADVSFADHLARRAAATLANLRLYRAAQREIEERRRAEAALHEADRRKDEFLAMLGHELRNPLGPIRNAVELLKLRGPLDPPLVRARDMIERQAAHMARLIDDLLDVARITRGKITLRREPVALAHVVEQAVETVRPQADRLGHRLLVGPVPDVRLEADPARLVQVVGNLLHNAVKFTPPGGRIALGARLDGDVVAVSVRDDGVGIPGDVLERVFEPFVQEADTLDRAQGGLGIGLTLVRRLVELHGGQVHARSDGRGHGSEFVVTLPVRCAAATAPSRTAAMPAAAGSRLRVMLVDDNADAAESLRMLLDVHGHDVRTAATGHDALDLAHEFVPHVAFVDIGLPGLDGYEVARRLRARPDGVPALLVAVSGYGRDEDKRRARDAGFDHHLTKPVDLDVVHDLLAAAAPPPDEPDAHAS